MTKIKATEIVRRTSLKWDDKEKIHGSKGFLILEFESQWEFQNSKLYNEINLLLDDLIESKLNNYNRFSTIIRERHKRKILKKIYLYLTKTKDYYGEKKEGEKQ